MINTLRTLSKKTRIAGAVLFIFGIALAALLAIHPLRLSAALIPGYSWSDTIGWVQMSDSGAIPYGFNIDGSGNITGYAWSENIGWISAQAADVAGCPAGTCAPKLTGSTITGWVKAIAANGNGWDGWISLSCANTGTCGTVNYGVTNTSGTYAGYGWGSDVVGWIDFSYAFSTTLACTITPSPSTILRGQNSSLGWATQFAHTGSISPTVGTVGTAASNWSVSPTNTTTYTGTVTRTDYSTTTGAGVNTTFNSSGTFVVPANIYSIDALLIAGGGAGAGGANGGGGGGGGVVETTGIAVVPGQTLTITVGAGGDPSGSVGRSGADSTIVRSGSTLALATGGGGGGNEGENGKAGGSGGGGGGTIAGIGGVGTGAQGNAGGTGQSSNRHAGGGGGAGAVGGSGASGGAGGAGRTTSANYGSLVVGGGGGGALERAWGAGTGGAGGSGGGGYACGPSGTTDSNGVAGTANTGGGGGGGGRCGAVTAPNTLGGAGGSGKIIIRYLSTTVTPTVTTATCSATVNVTCAPIYQCSGQTIQYTDASCNTSNVTTCVSPNYCTAGQSTCTVPPPSFTTSGSLTGHLEAKPRVVRVASSTVLYWNVANAQSCTVSGNGNTWTANSSGAASCATKINGGCVSRPINSSVTYTLSCTPLTGSTAPNVSETVTITPSPTYQEI